MGDRVHLNAVTGKGRNVHRAKVNFNSFSASLGCVSLGVRVSLSGWRVPSNYMYEGEKSRYVFGSIRILDTHFDWHA